MALKILYFAALREIAGKKDETLDLEDLPTKDLKGVYELLESRYPRFAALRGVVRPAVNQEFTSFDAMVSDGDEIAFIPPVSGGDDRFLLTKSPLESERVRGQLQSTRHGAVILFEGVVRDHTGDHDVSWLEYDAYEEMALSKIRQVAEEAETKFDGVVVAIHHRWGRLELGETAVITGVASAHRKLAYEASEFVIDRLKEVVPIWKKEVGPDGSEWVGMGP